MRKVFCNLQALFQTLCKRSHMFVTKLWHSLVVQHQHKRREELLCKQLSEVLRLLNLNLSGGQSLQAAIRYTCTLAPQPLAGMLQELLDKHRSGIPMSETLQDWMRQHNSEEMQLFAAALRIATESGSSLKSILSRLEELTHQKRAMRDKIASLTAQGKLQAGLMSTMPALIFIGINFVDTNFMLPLLMTTVGRCTLVLLLLLNLSGLVWMQKLMQPRW